MNKDYYGILNVKRSTSSEEIQTAYVINHTKNLTNGYIGIRSWH
jgi:hypothetical protein